MSLDENAWWQDFSPAQNLSGSMVLSTSSSAIFTCPDFCRLLVPLVVYRRRHPWTPVLTRNFSQFVQLQVFGRSRSHVLRQRLFPLFSPITVTVRGAKRSTVRAEDLCQGVIPLEPLPPEDGAPTYPTVLHQARLNMRKFENCVLLTRVGGFYELYFEQAEEFGPVLNLKVARKKTSAGPVSMAGFPFFHLDRFLKVLVQDHGRYVAIAEEFPNDPMTKAKSGGLMHDRRVARIITPGTLIDENFIDPCSNNYVLAIYEETTPASKTQHELQSQSSKNSDHTHSNSTSLGLAWLDLSTGSFFTQLTTLSILPSDLSRIAPREVVLDERMRAVQDNQLFSTLKNDRLLITYCSSPYPSGMGKWRSMLEAEISPGTAEEFTNEEIAAGSLLLHYVGTRLQSSTMRLQRPLRYQDMETMSIDKNSMRTLEIKETMRDGVKQGSLLHSMRRTVTQSGARLLEEWLTSPSTSISVITYRLNLVSRMLRDTPLREKIIFCLRRCHDSQRLTQKISLGRGNPEDLLDLASTIFATQDLVATLRGELIGQTESLVDDSFSTMVSRIQLDDPSALASRIKEALDEDGIFQRQRMDENKTEVLALSQEISTSQNTSEGIVTAPSGNRKKKPASIKEYYADNGDNWIMKPLASIQLSYLHKELQKLTVQKNSLEVNLQRQLGAPSLTLRWTPGLGYICHVKGKDTRGSTGLRSIGSSKSTKSLHHPDWTHLGQNIDQAKFRIRVEENVIFQKLREQVVLNMAGLRRNARVLDELDIACSFANLAESQNLVRPILNTSSTHRIVGGRHPTVQNGLQQQGRSFISNDCFVGDQERLWLITGPNMGGKSTFLRQNALITIMAQAGSFVPAEYAEIGIVDKIFSRVGSADNLYNDQSTFMVEMLETATILTQATSRSFVIMDEIGRGTTPEDGAAIAFASLHHLCHFNKCRTLFATHFHVLADLSKDMASVGYYHTDIAEDNDGRFTYIHRLRKGVNRASHAFKVARLAGVPDNVIKVAEQTLDRIHLTET